MKKKVVLIIVVGIILLISSMLIKKKQEKELEEKRIAEIKEGWHVEIINDYLNVREKADNFSNLIMKVNKGEVYKVIEYQESDGPYHWYKIEIDSNTEGYLANPKSISSKKYLNDINNPNDIANPRLSFQENVYYASSIGNINYKHLTLWDDKEGYVVTHKVYHEVDQTKNINQYWIKYTITDAVGKSSSKTQQIVFEKNPNENEVLDFYKEYFEN